MDRKAVISTNIASIGYDANSAILEIEFKHGGVYQYFNVPQVIVDQLLTASSIGGFFAANIKNHFQYAKT